MRYHEFLTEASHTSEIIIKMKAEYPDHAQYIDEQVSWAKNLLKKSDRISWWINIVYESLKTPNLYNIIELGEDIAHYCSYSTRVPSINSYQFSKKKPDQIINDLSRYLDDYETKQSAKSRIKVIPEEGDYKLIEFDDGSCWWFVDRAFCDQEGKSGRHCGNIMGHNKPDQRILSYRVNDVVMLTFILEPDKKLGEMKQWMNQHPQPKYHPYIMALLLNPIVKGISGGGSISHMNFSVFDLDEQNLNIIQQQKPVLIEDQINVSPAEVLKAPPSIKAQYYEEIIKKNPGIDKLLNADGSYNESLDAWREAIYINSELSLIVPDQYINEFRDIILKALRLDASLLITQASNAIRNDYDILKEFVTFNYYNIGYIQTNYKKYKELCFIAIEKDERALTYVSPEVSGYQEICLAVVTKNSNALRYVPRELRDPELCLAAVSNNGEALGDVPEELRDYDLCLAAVKQKVGALQHVPKPPKLPEDQYLEICLAAVTQNGEVLWRVPKELRDYDLCLAAVTNNGKALYYVSKPPKLPKDQYLKLCLATVKQNGYALEHVPNELRDPEICLAAMKQQGSLWDVPEKLRNYRMCMAAVKQDGTQISSVPKPPVIPEDKYAKICLAAVKQDSRALGFFYGNVIYKTNPSKYLEICKAAMSFSATQNNRHPIYDIDNIYDSAYLEHPELILYALSIPNKSHDPSRIDIDESWIKKHIPNVYETNRDLAVKIYLKLIEIHPNLVRACWDKQEDNPELAIAAVNKDARSIEYVSPIIYRNNPDIYLNLCKQSVIKDYYNLTRIHPGVRERLTDVFVDICKTAIEHNGYAIYEISTLNKIPDTKPIILPYESYLHAVTDNNAHQTTDDRVRNIIDFSNFTLGRRIRQYTLLHYVPDQYKDYKLCLAAVKHNVKAIDDVPDELQDRIKQKIGLL